MSQPLTPDEFNEIHAAARYLAAGHFGGFAGRLGDAMLYADPHNLDKLRRAFPDLIQRAWDAIAQEDKTA